MGEFEQFDCPVCGHAMRMLHGGQESDAEMALYVCTRNHCPCPEHHDYLTWPAFALRLRDLDATG